MDNDQIGGFPSQEDRPATIEREVRAKYASGDASAMQEALQELVELKIEYEELQQCMDEYEKEFEDQKVSLEKQIRTNEQMISKLETKLKKMEEDRNDYKKEATSNERELEKLQKQLTQTVDKGSNNQKRVVQLEIENEELQNEARHLGYIINDLELKFDTQLEEIELLQNELEEQKLHSEEQIERQKQQLQELTADLQVKERELRTFRLKKIFQSPPREKHEEGNASFAHRSARSTLKVRSITKTSVELKRDSLFDGDDSRPSKGDHSQRQHKRKSSHYSSALVFATDQERQPRRATYTHPTEKKRLASPQPESRLNHSRTEIIINEVDTDSLFDKTIPAASPEQKEPSPKEKTDFYPQPASEMEENNQSVKASLLAESLHQSQSKNLLGLENQKRSSNLASPNRSQSVQKLAVEKPVMEHAGSRLQPHKGRQTHLLNQQQAFEVPDNLMKLNDVDFDELLECAEENIENSAFFASSVQVMGIFDSMISAIDERIIKKKSGIISSKNNGVGMESHMLTAKVTC